ncbi:hypothetical protein BDK51DRAFT_27226, partial [Blyttiomyces helicus]
MTLPLQNPTVLSLAILDVSGLLPPLVYFLKNFLGRIEDKRAFGQQQRSSVVVSGHVEAEDDECEGRHQQGADEDQEEEDPERVDLRRRARQAFRQAREREDVYARKYGQRPHEGPEGLDIDYCGFSLTPNGLRDYAGGAVFQLASWTPLLHLGPYQGWLHAADGVGYMFVPPEFKDAIIAQINSGPITVLPSSGSKHLIKAHQHMNARDFAAVLQAVGVPEIRFIFFGHKSPVINGRSMGRLPEIINRDEEYVLARNNCWDVAATFDSEDDRIFCVSTKRQSDLNPLFGTLTKGKYGWVKLKIRGRDVHAIKARTKSSKLEAPLTGMELHDRQATLLRMLDVFYDRALQGHRMGGLRIEMRINAVDSDEAVMIFREALKDIWGGDDNPSREIRIKALRKSDWLWTLQLRWEKTVDLRFWVLRNTTPVTEAKRKLYYDLLGYFGWGDPKLGKRYFTYEDLPDSWFNLDDLDDLEPMVRRAGYDRDRNQIAPPPTAKALIKYEALKCPICKIFPLVLVREVAKNEQRFKCKSSRVIENRVSCKTNFGKTEAYDIVCDAQAAFDVLDPKPAKYWADQDEKREAIEQRASAQNLLMNFTRNVQAARDRDEGVILPNGPEIDIDPASSTDEEPGYHEKRSRAGPWKRGPFPPRKDVLPANRERINPEIREGAYEEIRRRQRISLEELEAIRKYTAIQKFRSGGRNGGPCWKWRTGDDMIFSSAFNSKTDAAFDIWARFDTNWRTRVLKNKEW